jgi:hypothetical protein
MSLNEHTKFILYQISAVILIYTVYSLGVLTYYLMNGPSATISLIQTNIVAWTYLLIWPIALVPASIRSDQLIIKLEKQLGLASLIFLGSSIIVTIYWAFNPPTTGLGRMVEMFSYMITFTGVVTTAVTTLLHWT